MFCNNSRARSRSLFGSHNRGLGFHIRSSRYLNKLAFLSAISAFALSFLILNPPVMNNSEANATTGTATASTTSITLTSLDNSATVDISSLTPTGSFTTSTIEQSATFSLTTNNYTGYTLAIIANDDNGNLSTTPEPGDTPETISSISTITSTEDFSASTTTAAENYNNKWGFRPNKYIDSANNTTVDNTGDNPVYLPSPTTTPTLLDKTTSANTPSTANTYTLALGLRANQDTKAGTYTKTFNLVVTANPISYTINYNQNTTDTVTNMPTTQASDTSSTSITLTNTVPQRSHYSFIGWCNTTTTTNNGIDSCNGTTYNPNGNGTNLTYGIDQTTANTTTLYAMWELEKFTITLTTTGGANGIVIDGVNYTSSISLAYGSTHTISGSYASGYEFDSWSTSGNISLTSTSSSTTTMTVTGAGTLTLNGKVSMASIQSITSATCPTDPTEVYDSRDNEVYTIQKLADGNCWLLDNLRLDLADPTVKANLSAANTNAMSATLNYLKNGGGTTSDQYAITGVVEWTSSPNYASSYSYSDPLIATSGICQNTNYCVNDPESGQWTKNSTAPLAMGQSGTGKVGVYYNFCAASAGSYCYGNGTSYGTSSGDAIEDICPAGWRMPTGRGNPSSEYQALLTAYSSKKADFVNALRTPLSGTISNSGLASNQGYNGFFWSSTRYTNGNVFHLWVRSTDVGPQGNDERYRGHSVRCILDASTTFYTITYNKNTNDAVSNMPITESGTINSFRNSALSAANVPTRSGYVFMGWCTIQPVTNNGIDSCSGVTYHPGSQFALNSNGSITLYAIWVAYSSLPTMQSITASTCSTSPMFVKDSRDNEIYTIQKLADGKCWLLDNLRLDLTDSTVLNALSTSNTNASAASLTSLRSGNRSAGDQYANGALGNLTAGNSYSVARVNADYKDQAQPFAMGQSGTGKIGVYYNYCAASAGSYCYGDGTSEGRSSGSAIEDICPAGWRMPTGGSSGEYQALYAAYSSDKAAFVNALRTPLSGYFYNGSARDQGSRGNFWSSTLGTGNMYRLNVDASNVGPQGSAPRFYGHPIRCILGS